MRRTDQIDRFTVFVEETRVRAVSLGRYPPKAGYTPYLLSFFWEARDSSWPIYYPRSRRALVRHGLFREEGPLARRYVSYRREILGLRDTLDTTTWGIEVLLFQLTADEESLSEQDRVALVAVSPIPDLEVSETYDSPELAEEARRQVNVLIDELAATNERIAEDPGGANRESARHQPSTWKRSPSAWMLMSLGFRASLKSRFTFPRPKPLQSKKLLSRWPMLSASSSLTSCRRYVDHSFGNSLLGAATWRPGPSLRPPHERVGAGSPTQKSSNSRQAEVNARQAEAVAYLLREVKPYTNASIRLGSIVVIKTGDDVAVNTLTPIEMLQISREPTLLADPSALLREIEPPSSE